MFDKIIWLRRNKLGDKSFGKDKIIKRLLLVVIIMNL